MWPFAQVRSLQNVSSLAIVGALTILGTVAIVVGRLAAMGALEDARWHLVDISSRDAPQKVGAVMTVVFSYCGQAIFTELITAMERPRDFPKAVWSSSLTMMLTYAVIAAAGYAALGSLAVAPVTSALPNDVWVLMANVLLFVHVLVAYVIEVNILSKGLINLLLEQMEQETGAFRHRPTCRLYAQWVRLAGGAVRGIRDHAGLAAGERARLEAHRRDRHRQQRH